MLATGDVYKTKQKIFVYNISVFTNSKYLQDWELPQLSVVMILEALLYHEVYHIKAFSNNKSIYFEIHYTVIDGILEFLC
jgi:hypothetical protein